MVWQSICQNIVPYARPFSSWPEIAKKNFFQIEFIQEDTPSEPVALVSYTAVTYNEIMDDTPTSGMYDVCTCNI